MIAFNNEGKGVLWFAAWNPWRYEYNTNILA